MTVKFYDWKLGDALLTAFVTLNCCHQILLFAILKIQLKNINFPGILIDMKNQRPKLNYSPNLSFLSFSSKF